MKTEEKVVTVKLGTNPDGTPNTKSRPYTRVIFEYDDVLDELQSSDAKVRVSVIEDLNYARDLAARAKVRNEIMSNEAAPERAFEQQVKFFMKAREAAGKPVSEEKARIFIRAQQDANLD